MRNQSGLSKALLWSAAGASLLVVARAAVQSVRHFDFRGKTVLITGGSRGLGLVLARELARDGARLAITARDEEELALAERELQSLGATVFSVRSDLREQSQADKMTASVLEHYGSIDVLINNAGMISVGPLEEMTVEDFRDAMDANFWSGVYTTLAVLPEMKSRQAGRIVNITSFGGKIAPPHLLPYAASKFAAVGFSRGLRSEVLKDGIIVTTVVPGLMRTGSPRNANFKGRNDREYAWFSVADSLPGLSIDAEKAAYQILAAARRGDVEFTLTLPARLAIVADTLFPSATGELFAIANRLLPSAGGIGRNIAKGSESESAMSPSFLTRLSDRAANKNNELLADPPV